MFGRRMEKHLDAPNLKQAFFKEHISSWVNTLFMTKEECEDE